MGSLLYEMTPGGVMVELHRYDSTDAEWDAMLDYLTVRKDRFKGLIALVENNAAPTQHQRHRLVDVIESIQTPRRTALLTDSRVSRAAITALIWMTRQSKDTKTFSPADLDAALVFLAVEEDEKALVKETLYRLKAQGEAEAARA